MAYTRRSLGLGAGAVLLAAPRVARPQGSDPLRLGLVQPMSGPLAAYGQETQPVIESLVRRINRDGGIRSLGGAPIELVLADDAGQPARAATEVRRLVTNERVACLAGGIITPEALAVGPVLDEYRVPMLSFFSGVSRSENLFSLGLPYDRGYAATMAGFIDDLARRKGFAIRRIVTASSNYEAGQQITRHLTERLKALGFEIAGDVPLDTKATDLTPAVLRIRSMKPDVVVGLQTQKELLGLQRARYDLQFFDAAFVSNLGLADTSIWKDLGEGVGSRTLLASTFGLAIYAPGVGPATTSNLPEGLGGGTDSSGSLSQFAVFAAQGILLLREVFERISSRDPERIRAGLAAIDLPFGHPSVIVPRQGGLTFAEDRLTKDAGTLVVQWSPDRQLQAVYPAAFASAEPRLPGR